MNNIANTIRVILEFDLFFLFLTLVDLIITFVFESLSINIFLVIPIEPFIKKL
jgi:hypothetical protein